MAMATVTRRSVLIIRFTQGDLFRRKFLNTNIRKYPMIRLKTKTFSSRSKMVLGAPALVLSYFGVQVSVANRIIKIRKSMNVHDTAMTRISFGSFFFTAERFGNTILCGSCFFKLMHGKSLPSGGPVTIL